MSSLSLCLLIYSATRTALTHATWRRAGTNTSLYDEQNDDRQRATLRSNLRACLTKHFCRANWLYSLGLPDLSLWFCIADAVRSLYWHRVLHAATRALRLSCSFRTTHSVLSISYLNEKEWARLMFTRGTAMSGLDVSFYSVWNFCEYERAHFDAYKWQPLPLYLCVYGRHAHSLPQAHFFPNEFCIRYWYSVLSKRMSLRDNPFTMHITHTKNANSLYHFKPTNEIL